MVSTIVAKAIVSRVIDCGVISTTIARMVSRVVNGIYGGHKHDYYGLLGWCARLISSSF